MKIFNFECYFCNPVTGETGWTIEFVNVYAESKAQAKELLKTIPNFDCVILFDYEIDIDESPKDVTNYANNGFCRFLDGYKGE